MHALSNLLAIGTLSLGLFHLTAAQAPPAAQLHIDKTCSDASSNLQEYVLYTYPENTSKCITIGAPSFPFSSTGTETQCGDYTNGGANYADCNNYPRNSLSVTLTGSIKCTFYSSEDCTEDDTHPSFGTLSNLDAKGACQDFPPQLPLSGGRKQSASSLTCSNA